jgi:ubiquinone/menaquinone biosynthesis C-methylase UbiE
MTTDWDSFFAEWYLRTYAPREDPEATEEGALGAARAAGVETGARVLDAPCGYGRHSIVLARSGYRVVGADRSPVLLEEARRRAGDLELELVEADYRELPFEDSEFDAVLNLFTSLGYLGREGDAEALREFRRVLRSGGRLVVETMHRDRLARIYQPRSWDELPDGGFVLEEREFDQVTSMISTTMTLFTPAEGVSSLSYELRVYTATELSEMAREAGFEDVACYGGFDGEELTWDTRLVLVAA